MEIKLYIGSRVLARCAFGSTRHSARSSLSRRRSFSLRRHSLSSARSSLAILKLKSRETTRDPSTPGTDISHKSVFDITPSVKMEHDIMSDISAGNAGVCIFVFITPRDGASTTRAPPAPILLTNPCSILHLR
jgi:hypothetical protein